MPELSVIGLGGESVPITLMRMFSNRYDFLNEPLPSNIFPDADY